MSNSSNDVKINDTAEKGRERQQGNKHSNAILADMSTRFASCFLTRLTNEQTACAVIIYSFSVTITSKNEAFMPAKHSDVPMSSKNCWRIGGVHVEAVLEPQTG